MNTFFLFLQQSGWLLAIGILLGVGVSLAVQRVLRNRPSLIRLLKIQAGSLVEIAAAVRHDLKVSYKGQPIQNLYQSVFSLQSLDDRVLDNLEIILKFEHPILDLVWRDPLATQRPSQAVLTDDGLTVRLMLPFLNPGLFFKDELQLQVFALLPVKVSAVQGAGRGWQVVYIDRVQLLGDILQEVSQIDPAQFISRPVSTIAMTAYIFSRIFPKLRKLLVV